MARRRSREAPSRPFANLGPTGVGIPISTGTVRLIPETDGGVLVEVNGVPSSYQHPDPRHLVFEYMRWMALVIDQAFGEEPEGGRALQIAHLGGGGCSLPRAIASALPRSRQVVVELDADLAELARDWFDLPRSPALRIRAEDAATALASWREARFDALIRDVFADARTPASLLGAEAAGHAARVLRPGGIYLVNSAGGERPATLLADEAATLSTAFAHLGIIAEPAVVGGRRRGNSVLVASDAPLPAGIDRALRSDPVSVRLLDRTETDRLVRSGRVLP